MRPILNLRLDKDVKAMRAIAEQAFAFVREYKGSHSGEHGDGIVRSEFHEFMFGKRLVQRLRGGEGPLRSGRASTIRARSCARRNSMTAAKFRYGPEYRAQEMTGRLDWSAYPGAGGGFQGAVEMCNNNGACRKSEGGVMCPSYRVTREERDVTRGRANSLRLAINRARSEFHEFMFGKRLVRAFEEVKDRFDPDGPLQSRQDRARAEVRRPHEFPLRAGLPRRRR